MKILLLFFLIGIATHAYSQRYVECNPSGSAAVSADTVARCSIALNDYLVDKLGAATGNFKGIIIIQVFVNKEGVPCCFNIQNNISKMKSADIKTVIDNMPRWRPAVYNETSIDFMAVIWLEKKDSQLQVRYVNGK